MVVGIVVVVVVVVVVDVVVVVVVVVCLRFLSQALWISIFLRRSSLATASLSLPALEDENKGLSLCHKLKFSYPYMFAT